MNILLQINRVLVSQESVSFPLCVAVPFAPGVATLSPAGQVVGWSVLEDGEPILADLFAAQLWPDGSVRWAHAWFSARWQGGQPSFYSVTDTPPAWAGPVLASYFGPDLHDGSATFVPRRQSIDDGVAHAGTLLRRDQLPVEISTGWVLLRVAARLAGPAMVTVCSPGPSGWTESVRDVVVYCRDDRNAYWSNSLAPEPEQAYAMQVGRYTAEIKLAGYLQSTHGGPPWLTFDLRARVFFGLRHVFFAHRLILSDDMRDRGIRECGVRLVAPTVRRQVIGAMVAAPATTGEVTVTSIGPTAVRIGIGGPPLEMENPLAGYSAAVEGKTLDNRSVSVCLREMGPAYPKGLKAAPGEILVQQYPPGLQGLGFNPPRDGKAVSLGQWWHGGTVWPGRVPTEIAEYLEPPHAKREDVEPYPEAHLAGDTQGWTWFDEFAVTVAAEPPVPIWQSLYETSPIGLCDPEHVCRSGANGLSRIAPRRDDWAKVEDFLDAWITGWLATASRLGLFGRWNLGDYPEREVPETNSIHYHRPWIHGHFGYFWLALHVMRTGDVEVAAAYRRIIRHLVHVDQISFDGEEGFTQKDYTRREGVPQRKFHREGGFGHKGFWHFPAGDYGMPLSDVFGGLKGHWVHPDSIWWGWILTGQTDLLEGYLQWAGKVAPVEADLGGATRESVTEFVQEYGRLEALGVDPATSTGLVAAARGLLSKAIQPKWVGPLWEPRWDGTSRRLAPDLYASWLLFEATKARRSNVWSIDLSCENLLVGGPVEHIRRHLPEIATLIETVVKDWGSTYFGYGLGPGPLGEKHVTEQWPRLLYELRSEDIGDDQLPPPRGSYPVQRLRVTGKAGPGEARGAIVLAWKEGDGPLVAQFAFSAMGGSQHDTKIDITGPDNQPAAWASTGAVDEFGQETTTMSIDGPPGLYRLHVRSYEVVLRAPVTNAREVLVLQETHPPFRWRNTDPKDESIMVGMGLRGVIQPIDAGDVLFFKVAVKDGLNQPVNVESSRGLAESLLRSMGDTAGSFYSPIDHTDVARWQVSGPFQLELSREANSEGKRDWLAYLGDSVETVEFFREHADAVYRKENGL